MDLEKEKIVEGGLIMSTIELVAIYTTNNNIKARRLDTGEKVVWRGRKKSMKSRRTRYLKRRD